MRVIGCFIFVSLFFNMSFADQCEEKIINKFGIQKIEFEFMRCVYEPDKQGKPLTAQYRVKGSEMIRAERYLQNKFQIKPMDTFMSIWGSDRNSFNKKNRNSEIEDFFENFLEIRVYSFDAYSKDGFQQMERTRGIKKMFWYEIDYFYIYFIVYIEGF